MNRYSLRHAFCQSHLKMNARIVSAGMSSCFASTAASVARIALCFCVNLIVGVAIQALACHCTPLLDSLQGSDLIAVIISHFLLITAAAELAVCVGCVIGLNVSPRQWCRCRYRMLLIENYSR